MKYLLSVAVLMSLLACDMQSEINTTNSMKDSKKVWVFAQFNVPEEKDKLDSYYYYGQISKKLYEAISNNEIESGFIHLSKVKYWGDDDLIHEYKDIENSGNIIFRIEHIAKVVLVNLEPTVGKGLEQFEVLKKEKNTEEKTSAKKSEP